MYVHLYMQRQRLGVSKSEAIYMTIYTRKNYKDQDTHTVSIHLLAPTPSCYRC